MHHTTMAPAPQNHKFALKVGKPVPHVHKIPHERFRNRVDSPVNWFAGSTIEPCNRRLCLPGGPLPTTIAKVNPTPDDFDGPPTPHSWGCYFFPPPKFEYLSLLAGPNPVLLSSPTPKVCIYFDSLAA